MNFNEIIKVAWKSIASNKSRSVLTMLGVIIGVAAVIVMMGVSAGTPRPQLPNPLKDWDQI